jgi:hypothetical protein
MTRIIGAGGGGGCFLGHTAVRIPEGQRRIDELQPGDLVLSFDDRGEVHQAKILKVHVHEGERVVRYQLWGGAVLDATPNHWVLNQFNAFVEIDTLGEDDCLVDENGHLRPIVDKADLCIGTVYNLTVEGHHTFIAGGIRVHNAGLGLGNIAGAGGGGKKSKGGGGEQRTPTEAADNLNSTQYAKLVDLISEGEIQGLKDGDKSIFLDDTPLQNANGSYNFQNVTVETRNGTQNQTFIPLAADIENEKPVGVKVEQATPIVRSVTDSNVNAARVSITVPQLQRFTDQGDIEGTSIRLQIAVQYNSGGYTTVIDDTISGRTADTYQRDYLVSLTGTFPVDIKITRITGDSSSAKLTNAFSWSSYTEITYAKLRYPNSALIGLRVDADQFSSIPNRSYLIRGIKVRIPSNATVDSTTGRLIYSGIWSGSFGAAQWTSDPAWCLWDLLTSTRYGFGDHIKAAQLDKWAFYAASQYASELVPNGFGGTEPRFSCNINIQTAEEAYKLINDMCSVFLVMPYWSTGALTVSQDRPADSAYLFTLANVTEEGFSYQGSSRKTRPTVAVVSYLDLNSRDIAYEVVEDQDAIAKFGVVTTQISAFACTSQGQASRIGEWLLYSEHYESEVIGFTASIDAGVVVRPGQIIEVSDPTRAGSRRGGRIRSATSSSVTVDDATGLTSSGATLSVIMPDGTVQSRTVSGIAGNVISLTTALSTAPNANSVWIFQTNDLQTSTWRVLTVSEQEGAQYGITALAYNASKYDYIERGALLQQRDTTNLNALPEPPANITIAEALYENSGRALFKLIITWQAAVGINEYLVRWRQQSGNWTNARVQRFDYEIFDAVQTTYEIQVYSLNAAGKQSTQPSQLTYSARGKSAPPADITNAYGNVINPQTLELAWDLHPDLDVRVGGKILIRHTPRTTGSLWVDATTVVPAVTGNQTRKVVPLMAGTYLLRAQDDTGNLSTNAVGVIISAQLQPDPTYTLRIASSPAVNPDLTFAEDLTTPPFQGNLTNMYYDVGLDGLILAYGTLVDDMAPDIAPGGALLDENGDLVLDENGDPMLSEGDTGSWDALTTIDGFGGPQPSGEYEFGSTMDLGAVYEVNLRARLQTRAFNPANLWDAISNVDELTIIDDVSGKPDALLKFRYSDNGSTYSDWVPFQSNLVRGRAFQFKLAATSGNLQENILVEELGVAATLPQVSQTAGPITSGAGAYSATFSKGFYAAPQVAITALNMATGDYADISSVTRTGFQVTFRNSGGTAVSRQFHYTATSYGREI